MTKFVIALMKYFGDSERRRYVNAFVVLYAIVVIIVGGFFIPPTILRDSLIAREAVAIATTVFPWLENIRKIFGEAGERGLFIHSLVFASSGPPAALILLTNRPENRKIEDMLIELRSFTSVLAGLAALGMVISTYFLLRGGGRFLERIAFLDPIGTALIALCAVALFWDGVGRLVLALISLGIKNNGER